VQKIVCQSVDQLSRYVDFSLSSFMLEDGYSRPFWRGFLLVLPMNVVKYCRDPKGTSLSGNTRSGVCPDRSKNQPGRVGKKAKNERKKSEM